MQAPQRTAVESLGILAVAVGVLGASLLAGGPASACATCALGDPTLTTMGLEKPVEGRKRVSATVHHRSLDEGTPGIDRVVSDEQRLELAFLLAPTRWLAASVHLPLVRKHRSHVSGSEETAWGVGELALQGRLVIWQAPRPVVRHVLSLELGLTLPTAPALKNPQGVELDAALQAGVGSLMLQAGMAYGYFSRPWAAFVSTSGRFPGAWWQRSYLTLFNIQPGSAWLSSAILQRSITDSWSLQIGADTRLATPDTFGGVDEPNSGGFVLAGSGGVVWSPLTNLVLHVTLRVPAFQSARGVATEGLSAVAGLSWDL